GQHWHQLSARVRVFFQLWTKCPCVTRIARRLVGRVARPSREKRLTGDLSPPAYLNSPHHSIEFFQRDPLAWLRDRRYVNGAPKLDRVGNIAWPAPGAVARYVGHAVAGFSDPLTNV